ncbi:hypothetical protein IMG5_191890 [Ichthyophthirius multifiliis]|uniref:Potassium channel domain-containing protein n=1 Tax=Ichthyophthirius multifiliis TaxID=5932 RepID=G0R4E9_ICHMU|nr:hypothetical protein IMG5_191890 [Ichthyophthirius multifiliis]EGR27650.1 hypothetical protein IMG5_191890 [Ichthyophthirius multifiliis]|eukprot:XP_004025102.1 hypothetical protein IMG5_191890 [Ichthyophthirius multifiliis]
MYSGWVHEQLYTDPNDFHKVGKNIQFEFIASLYWVFTTLTTLGYGDFYGQTVNEYIFTMFVEFIGVFVFAYMMGNINNLIEKLNDDHVEYIQNENENLDQWIIKIDRANPTRKLPQTFIDDLRKRFTIYWQKDHTTVVQEYPFFNQLPVDLREQVTVASNDGVLKYLTLGSSPNTSSQFNAIEEQQKNEIIKLAKDLNDKIEHLKSALSQLDNEVKVKVQNIKTELEFIARYEEVIHGYDEDNQ